MASAASDSDKILSRDELLAQFQNITGIEDVDICVRFLENNQWKLKDAIETALAVGGDLLNIGGKSVGVGGEKTADEVEVLTAHDLDSASSDHPINNPFRALIYQDDNADVLYSRQPPFELDSYPGVVPRRRMLHFDISYRGSQYEFAVRDDETIGDLKRYIIKELAPTVGRLEPKDMDLRGWRAVGQSDDTTLCSLHLPSENWLELITISRLSGINNSDTAESEFDCLQRIIFQLLTGDLDDVVDEKKLLQEHIWCILRVGSNENFPPTTLLNRTFLMEQDDASQFLIHLRRFCETIQESRALSKRVLVYENDGCRLSSALFVGYMMTITNCDLSTIMRYLNLRKPGRVELHPNYKSKLLEYELSQDRTQLRRELNEIFKVEVVADSNLVRYFVENQTPKSVAVVQQPKAEPPKDTIRK